MWGLEAQALARGHDPRPVVPNREAKSIGAEATFEHDIVDRARLERHLLEQSARVARRLCHEGLQGRIVVLKLKFADFTLLSRRTALPEPIGDTDSIFEVAKQLLDRVSDRRAVRLTGVSVSGLCRAETARSLFAEPRLERRRSLEQLTARIHDKFGGGALKRAALLVDDDPEA
jgi:DNA polymerase-4